MNAGRLASYHLMHGIHLRPRTIKVFGMATVGNVQAKAEANDGYSWHTPHSVASRLFEKLCHHFPSLASGLGHFCELVSVLRWPNLYVGH